MGELLFVGLGLCDEKDLSQRAMEDLAGCGAIFAEQYTSRWGEGALSRLGSKLGREVQELSREEVEGERRVLDALAQGGSVALLVVGEPFAATTHLALRLSAEAHGHTWRVLHNASILTAAASLVGLSHYRFGRTVSLPRPRPGFRPTSPYDALLANWKAELHTLVLLDLDPAEGHYLTAGEALRLLGELETERRGGVLPPEREVAVIARAGAPDAKVVVGPRGELEARDFGPPLHCLILPSPSLHFVEEEAWRSWRKRAAPGT